MQKSMDTDVVAEEAIDFTLQTTDNAAAHIEIIMPQEAPAPVAVQKIVQEPAVTSTEDVPENIDQVFVTESGFLMLHKEHPDYLSLIRLQLENQELINWKQQLQARINAERAECLRIKRLLGPTESVEAISSLTSDDPEYERIVDQYMKENALLEQKRALLAKEILDENISLIQLQVDLAMKQFIH